MKWTRKILTLLLLLPLTAIADNLLHSTIANALVRPDGARLVPYQWETPPTVIVLYFGAEWCAPCHAFTPKLRDVYENLRANDVNTEVVYVSLDHSEAAMRRYLRMAGMPWSAISPRRLRTLPTIGALAGPAPPNLVLVGGDGEVIASAWDGRRWLGLQQVLYAWIQHYGLSASKHIAD